MRQRIRNILLEILILESPLFKAVAVMLNGKVYKGKPDEIHSNVLQRIIDMVGEDVVFEKGAELESGYITMGGKFVNRDEASEMMNGEFPESWSMQRKGYLSNEK